jgi:thioredoxin reductase (NADPH)
MYDTIVIGNGPAGLSATLYLCREGYKVLVLGNGCNIEKCKEMKNYLGIESISGTDFINISKKQVISVGAEMKQEKVLSISKNDGIFNIVTDTNEYASKTVVMALGIKKSNIIIENASKFIGKGVSYCVSCDGYYYRNKNVGIIGSSENAVEEALNLKNYTDNITIYTNGEEMDINEKYITNLKLFNVDNRKIKSLYGDNELTHIIFDGDEKIGVDGIFLANNTPNIDDLSNSIGIITKDKHIVIDENNMTNIDGIFVCGDMINSFKQVATAVGSGAFSGFSCIKYLINLKLDKEK